MNRLELLANIVETFEDFLDEKGIVIDNPEKEEDEFASNIYGTDFGNLCDAIENVLINYDLLKGE